MEKISRRLRVTFILLMIIGSIGLLTRITTYALEDGAYVVGRTSTYINPDTGLTSRGDTGNATGDNMAARILAPDVLVEQVAGRTYVTVGLGMQSAISNVKIQIQTTAGGAFQEVPHVVTGTSILNDDTCRHYRFEVVSPYLNISPKFVVDGMGMELEFYIILNMNSLTPGSSIFLSEMVPNLTPVEETPETSDIAEDEDMGPTEEELAAAELFASRQEQRLINMDPEGDPLDRVHGLSTHMIMRKQEDQTSTSQSYIWLYVLIGSVSIAASAGGFFFYKKKRRTL